MTESKEELNKAGIEGVESGDVVRQMYEELGVFPGSGIDHQIELLEKENDEKLNQEFAKLPAEERLTATRELMHKDIHRH